MKIAHLHIPLTKVMLLLFCMLCWHFNGLSQTAEDQLAQGKHHLINYELEEGLEVLGNLYNDLSLQEETDVIFLNEVKLSYAMLLEKSYLDEASLKLLQDLEIDTNQAQLVQHQILGEITKARLNEKLGLVDEAYSNLERAYLLLQQTNDQKYLARYHKRLASLIRVSGGESHAIFSHLDSAEINAKRFNDSLELGDIYMVKAIMEGTGGNYSKSEGFLDKSSNYWQGVNDEHGKMALLMIRSNLKLKQNAPYLALALLDSAKTNYHPEKYLAMETGLLYSYLKVYERLELKDSIISTLKAIDQSARTTENEKNKLSIMHLNLKTRKLDLENELALIEKEVLAEKNKTNTYYILFSLTLVLAAILFIFLSIGRKNRKKISKQKIELEKALADNKILFAEVHHRVKNNISIISSMMQIQQREISDPLLKQKLIDNELRIRSIGLVHTLIFNYDQIQKLKIGAYMDKLVNGILETYDSTVKTKVDINASAVKADINIMVPIGLLMNELITNSVKYANVENLELKIEIKEVNQILSIRYSDNGKGFDSDKAPQSFGLDMIKRMTRQVEGEITFSAPGSHEVKINIPLTAN